LPGAPGLLTLLMGRCRLYREAGDLARSVEIGEEALGEVRALGLEGTEEEIKLASTLVAAYWARGDLFSAQRLADQVIERAERLGSRTARGSAYWNATLVAADAGQLSLALDLAAKTLALVSESSPERYLAEMRITYAWLLLRCDPPKVQEADTMLARAHDVMTEAGYGPILASCETEMARSALIQGDFDAAGRYADSSVSRFAEEGPPEREQAKLIGALAAILGGDVEAGYFRALAAAQQLESLGSRLDAAQAYRDLSDAMFEQGRSEEAVAALRKSADCAGVRPSSVRAAAAAHARV
jgi:tetratricopeptide (TPR) repeat protein